MLYLLDGLQANDYSTLEKWYDEHDFLNADNRIEKTLTKDQLNKERCFRSCIFRCN